MSAFCTPLTLIMHHEISFKFVLFCNKGGSGLCLCYYIPGRQTVYCLFLFFFFFVRELDWALSYQKKKNAIITHLAVERRFEFWCCMIDVLNLQYLFLTLRPNSISWLLESRGDIEGKLFWRHAWAKYLLPNMITCLNFYNYRRDVITSTVWPYCLSDDVKWKPSLWKIEIYATR